MTLDELSIAGRSLLLYLEARSVDYGGLVDTRRMNKGDMDIANKWSLDGFVKFGRLSSVFLETFGDGVTHWCELSDEAWALAHAERRARNARMDSKRTWFRTNETAPHIPKVVG